MAREKLCVGIDIGASSVKLCMLKRVRGTLTLEHFAHLALPSETIVDGALMNSARIVDAIQELLAGQRVKHNRAAFAISGHSVIIKSISLPKMTPEELEESIKWEAEQYIPFDIDDVFVDVQIVNESSVQAGEMDVVLVAAKKDFVNEYASVIIESGLQPMVCDVDPFAVETMFLENYDLVPGETVVLVNVGASKSSINVLVDGVSRFTRDLGVGGQDFTEDLQKQLNITYEEAENLKLGTGGGDMVRPEEIQRILRQSSDNLTTEIQRSIDFYAATSAQQPPSHMYLTGGTANAPALAQAIEARMRVPVEVVDPFRRIDIGEHDEEYVRSLGSAAGVVVGLALRFPGDN